MSRFAPVLVLFALHASPSMAQESPEDVQAAANAFADAQRAQLRRDFARAAELFEIADQAAPSPAALRSAIRNHLAAGHDARAGSLALSALARYGDDGQTRRFADGVVAQVGSRLGRLHLQCSEPCTATLDGGTLSTAAATSHDAFFLTGTHTLDVSFEGRPPVRREVDGAAGQTEQITIDAPAAPPPEPEPLPEPPPEPAPLRMDTSTPSGPVDEDESGGGLSPAVFWVGAVLTAVSGGVLAWSALDTLEKRDEYVADPTRGRYERGTDLELRTNILIAATAGLGVITLAIGLFATDWGGDDSEVALDVAPGRLALSFGRTWP